MPRSKQVFKKIDKHECAFLTQAEVAEIMTARGYPMGRANVWEIERRALRKLRDGLREFYEANFLND